MEQVICAVCRAVYVQPRVLLCGHSFCTNCLISCISHNEGCNLSCPLCNTSTNACSQRDIQYFPRNFELENAINLLSENPPHTCIPIEDVYLDLAVQRSLEDLSRLSIDPETSDEDEDMTLARAISLSEQDSSRIKRRRDPSQTDIPIDDVALVLAVQLSLTDFSSSQFDPATAQEDLDLATAIYLSQLDS